MSLGLIDALSSAANSGTEIRPSTSVSAAEVEQTKLQEAGIISPIIDAYTKIRAGLGYNPATGGWLNAVIVSLYAVVLVVVFIFGIALNYLWNLKPFRYTLIGIVILLILSGISYAVYYYLYLGKEDNIIDAALADFKSILGKEPFQNPEPTSDEFLDQPLLNVQPLALKQTGFIGPTEKGGLFEPTEAIQASLKAGVRFFVFQVDFLEASKDSKKFADKGEPTLLYRDDKGTLISGNGGDLKKVAQTLADYAFSEEVIHSSLPIVIYLHFVRTPSPVKSPEEYVNFLSKTAAALEPLYSRLPGGSYGRQQSEATLFKTPVRTFQKQVLYFANVDTAVFRKPEILGMKPFDPKYDLDNLVHAQVYADTSDDMLGATIRTADEKPNAPCVIASWGRLKGLGEKAMDTFAQRAKSRFVIAMPGQVGNPSKAEIETALNRLGVNVLPLNLFGESAADLQKKLGLWKGQRFLHVKPPALRLAELGGILPAAGLEGLKP